MDWESEDGNATPWRRTAQEKRWLGLPREAGNNELLLLEFPKPRFTRIYPPLGDPIIKESISSTKTANRGQCGLSPLTIHGPPSH